MLFKLNNNKLEQIEYSDISVILNSIKKSLGDYRYDHYRYYPSIKKGGWKNLFLESLEKDLKNECFTFIYSINNNIPALLGFCVNNWDEEVFGFKIANSVYTFFPDGFNSNLFTRCYLIK